MKELTTGDNGTSNTVTLSAGTYYVKEITAPKNFKKDGTVHTVKVESGKTARRFRDKKYMAIISSGQPRSSSEYRFLELIIGCNRRHLSMEAADCFLVDSDNMLYMRQAVPFAVTTFVTTYVTFHNDSYAWLKHRYGLLIQQ